MKAALQTEMWCRCPDRPQTRNLGGHRQDQLFAKRRADDLQADRQAARIEAGGDGRDRQAGHAPHERRGNPVHVGRHRPAGHGLRVVVGDRKRRHRHARRDHAVHAREQVAAQVPQPAARLLGVGELLDRGLEAGPHVIGHVGAEAVALRQVRAQLGHEPQAAQAEERRAHERQVEVLFPTTAPASPRLNAASRQRRSMSASMPMPAGSGA